MNPREAGAPFPTMQREPGTTRSEGQGHLITVERE
jgi:hypothetical protein